MTVTNAGLAEVAELIIGSGVAFDSLAIGTGTANFNATSTELNDEYQRASATLSTETTDTTGDTAQLLHTFTFTESKAITEAGVFNHASTGDMLVAQTFSAVNVVNGDSLQITYQADLD